MIVDAAGGHGPCAVLEGTTCVLGGRLLPRHLTSCAPGISLLCPQHCDGESHKKAYTTSQNAAAKKWTVGIMRTTSATFRVLLATWNSAVFLHSHHARSLHGRRTYPTLCLHVEGVQALDWLERHRQKSGHLWIGVFLTVKPSSVKASGKYDLVMENVSRPWTNQFHYTRAYSASCSQPTVHSGRLAASDSSHPRDF